MIMLKIDKIHLELEVNLNNNNMVTLLLGRYLGYHLIILLKSIVR